MTTSSFPPIHKPSRDEMSVAPNLEYAKTRADFDWQQMYSSSDWLPGGYLNKAHEAIDRHANGPRRDKIAMIWEGKNGEREDYTFGQLKTLTNRFANVIKSLGIETGDRVFLFMDRLPETYIAFFGILKAGAVVGPLFSAFGPDPVRDRLQDSGAKVLVTQPELRPPHNRHNSRAVRAPAHHRGQQEHRDSEGRDMADHAWEERWPRPPPTSIRCRRASTTTR